MENMTIEMGYGLGLLAILAVYAIHIIGKGMARKKWSAMPYKISRSFMGITIAFAGYYLNQAFLDAGLALKGTELYTEAVIGRYVCIVLGAIFFFYGISISQAKWAKMTEENQKEEAKKQDFERRYGDH